MHSERKELLGADSRDVDVEGEEKARESSIQYLFFDSISVFLAQETLGITLRSGEDENSCSPFKPPVIQRVPYTSHATYVSANCMPGTELGPTHIISCNFHHSLPSQELSLPFYKWGN